MRAHFRFCILILIAAVLSPFLARPQAPPAAGSQPFPPGIYIHGLLKNDLSTRKSKIGDPVELEVVRPVSVYDGHKMQLLVTEHARLLGTVTMVRRSAKDQPARLAIRMVEARSKSGSQPFDGILGRYVLVIHELPVFAKGANSSYNGVRNDSGMWPLDGATVVEDPTFGSVLSSRRDFTLVKNEAQLSIITR